MKLQDKFKRLFDYPLICGMFFVIIITVSILIITAYLFIDDQISQTFRNKEDQQSLPLTIIINNIIHNKFQQMIYNMTLMIHYYKKLLIDISPNMVREYLQGPPKYWDT